MIGQPPPPTLRPSYPLPNNNTSGWRQCNTHPTSGEMSTRRCISPSSATTLTHTPSTQRSALANPLRSTTFWRRVTTAPRYPGRSRSPANRVPSHWKPMRVQTEGGSQSPDNCCRWSHLMPRLLPYSICLQASLPMPPIRPRSSRRRQSNRMMKNPIRDYHLSQCQNHRPLDRCHFNLPCGQCSPTIQSATLGITSTAQHQLCTVTTINRAPLQILPTLQHFHPRRMLGRRQLLSNLPQSIRQHTSRQCRTWTPVTRIWITSRPIRAMMMICRTTHRPMLPHPSGLRWCSLRARIVPTGRRQIMPHPSQVTSR